jgi:hypothetical protein
MQQNTRRQCALFLPPPQSFKPASTHREEEEVVQPMFGVERNLPCTDQTPKANTHNKQSLLSAKKFLVLDLSSLKNPYRNNNTLGSRSHRKRNNNNNRSKHKHTETETARQKANQISKQKHRIRKGYIILTAGLPNLRSPINRSVSANVFSSNGNVGKRNRR